MRVTTTVGEETGLVSGNSTTDGGSAGKPLQGFVWGTTDGRKGGTAEPRTTGTEETQTAADSSGTATETTEDQRASIIWRDIYSSFEKTRSFEKKSCLGLR